MYVYAIQTLSYRTAWLQVPLKDCWICVTSLKITH